MSDPGDIGLGALALDDDVIDRIEEELQRPRGTSGAFTPLQMSTAVVASRVESPRLTHRELIKVIQAAGLDGDVVAVNSNFGGACQPGYEHKVKRGAKEQPMAPAGRKHRQHEGIGGCINSSIEALVCPSPDSDMGRRLMLEKGKVPTYNVKLFPTRGSIQVPGSLLEDFSDGLWAMHTWVDYLNRKNIFGGEVRLPAVDFVVDTAVGKGYWCDLVNFKFRLDKATDRQVLNFQAFVDAALDPGLPWPAPVPESTVNMRSKSFNFCYRTPAVEGGPAPKDKSPRVNTFTRSGKINLLGCPSREFGRQVYDLLDRIVSERWDEFVVLEPLPDDDIMTPRDELVWCLRAAAARAENARDGEHAFSDAALSAHLDELMS